MEKTLFTEHLDSLGEFRKREGTDPQFVPKPTTAICPWCHKGNYLVIEKKWNGKYRPYWRVKCMTCKETWQKEPL
jgi:ssDNA-binding Zn-finger/Zn-ribbon topoisomerase 1